MDAKNEVLLLRSRLAEAQQQHANCQAIMDTQSTAISNLGAELSVAQQRCAELEAKYGT
jgi:hypothetical protein